MGRWPVNEEKRSAIAAAARDALTALNAGRVEIAAEGFESVLKQAPDNPEAHYFLAVIAYQAERLADAHDRVLRAIGLRPDAADCHNLNGLVLLALGRPQEACTALRQALDSEPEFADAANNLGAALEAMAALDEAEAAYRRAIDIDPAYAQAYCNLSRILLASGRPADAESACRAALSTEPDFPDALFNLAVAQQRQGATVEAESTVEIALSNTPQNAELLRFFGVLRHGHGNLIDAESVLRDAIALQPQLAEAHDNLAGVLLDQGRVDDAETSFRQALAINPQDSRAHSNLLLCRNYYETDSATLFEAHKEWATQHAPAITQPRSARPNRSPRLRIGYVSGDLRRHSVAYFFEPLLQHRDRARFEVFCYANLENPDAVTERLQALSDHWRWVAGLDDNRLTAAIRQDGIDILIDLSGHSARNRLPVFQRKPAPVQATWLGYPNTTGLTAIDYRITDAIADPSGADRFASETLIRLDGGFLCSRPPEQAPEVAATPSVQAGHITFGSFNNLRKITPETIGI